MPAPPDAPSDTPPRPSSDKPPAILFASVGHPYRLYQGGFQAVPAPEGQLPPASSASASRPIREDYVLSQDRILSRKCRADTSSSSSSAPHDLSRRTINQFCSPLIGGPICLPPLTSPGPCRVGRAQELSASPAMTCAGAQQAPRGPTAGWGSSWWVRASSGGCACWSTACRNRRYS